MTDPKMNYGLKETKEALDLVLAVYKAQGAVRADGKIDLNDLPHVMAILPVLSPGLDAVALVPKELGDLDSAEASELIAYVGSKLVVDSPKAQIILAHSFKILSKAHGIYLDVVSMKGELAALAPVPAAE